MAATHTRHGAAPLCVSLLVAVSMGSCQGFGPDRSLVVATTSGAVAGVKAADGLSWRGIPYAAPPTGDLRWESPVAPKPWTEALVADKFGEATESATEPTPPCVTSALHGHAVHAACVPLWGRRHVSCASDAIVATTTDGPGVLVCRCDVPADVRTAARRVPAR